MRVPLDGGTRTRQAVSLVMVWGIKWRLHSGALGVTRELKESLR